MKINNRITAVLSALLLLSAVGCSADDSGTPETDTQSETLTDDSTDISAETETLADTTADVTEDNAEEYPFTVLTELLNLTPPEIREKYGEMTYEYSEYGGSPTYSLEKTDGVLVQYISGEANALPDDALPYEIIVTEEYSGSVCGLAVGMDVSEAEAAPEWDETWYSVINGTTHLSVTVGSYTLQAVLNSDIPTVDNGELVPAFDWEDEFLPSPYGEILQLRISNAKEEPVNKAAEKVTLHSNDGELNILPLSLPLTSADTRYLIFDYDDRFVVYVTFDAIFDEDRYFKYYDNVYVYIIDVKKGKFVYRNRLNTEHCPSNISYTDSGCVLYSVGDNGIAYAFEIDLTVDGFSGREVEISRDSLINTRCVSEDGQYTAVRWSDKNGVDLISPDGTTTRILQDKTIEDGYSMGDCEVYSPVGFLDNTHLLYYIGGWEWSNGCGIYDVMTSEATHLLDGRYTIEGTADGEIYLKFKESGADTVVGTYDSIWKYTSDGELIMLASTVNDDAVQISPSTMMFFENSLWCNYTNTEPGSNIGEFTETVTVTLYSPDFGKKLADIVYDTGSNIEVFENSVTVVVPDYAE